MKIFDFKMTYTLPFKFAIPNAINNYIKKRSFIGSRLKFIKRCLYLKYKRQILLEINNISSHHQKILWINISAPSLGDSLMDLSSRQLLENRKIDLFTHKKNASIYLYDYFFSSVFSDFSEIGNRKYDLVIMDSFSTRSVFTKSKIALTTPFVSMFGHFNGPEVNRVLFSFHQMNNLLGSKLDENYLNKIAKTSMFLSPNDKQIISNLSLPSAFISVVIGGEWDFRTFNNWDKVIEKLIEFDPMMPIILLGSSNGFISANNISKMHSSNKVINYVSKYTFCQTAEIINQSKLVFCCDGGLMHVANAFGTPSIALLAKLNQDMQLTDANNCIPIYDKSNVNNIAIEEILSKYIASLNSFDSHLPSE
jgi:ADP-heptose:LPS heptosyltransferase